MNERLRSVQQRAFFYFIEGRKPDAKHFHGKNKPIQHT